MTNLNSSLVKAGVEKLRARGAPRLRVFGFRIHGLGLRRGQACSALGGSG